MRGRVFRNITEVSELIGSSVADVTGYVPRVRRGDPARRSAGVSDALRSTAGSSLASRFTSLDITTRAMAASAHGTGAAAHSLPPCEQRRGTAGAVAE